MKIGYQQFIADAQAEIRTRDVAQAQALHDAPDALYVDLRDIRKLQRKGTIPGACHAPHGMPEFRVDPANPYHRTQFAEPHRFVFFCQSGWRSALATQTVRRMGLENVCHIGGGYAAWKQADAPTVPVERR